MAIKRIGVYGGSFNPVHNGHVSLVKEVLAKELVDEVIVTVSPWNPFKKNDGMVPIQYEDRLNMTAAAFKGIGNVYVSSIESSLGETSRTYITMQKLEEMYCGIKGQDYVKNAELVVIVGSDTWNQIGKFYEHEKLLAEYEFIVMQRGRVRLGKEPQGTNVKKVTFIEWVSEPVSSTMIREMVMSGQAIHPYVCDTVEKIILTNRFYRKPVKDMVLKLFELLYEKQLKISTAESCTGGLIAAAITDIPGSSKYLSGSVVSYGTEIKERVLGVDPSVIKEKTVVSMEVAKQMAEGVAKFMNTQCAISVTGYAGPDDEESGKIYVCAYIQGYGSTVSNCDTRLADRQLNREIAVIRGISMMTELLKEFSVKNTK